MTATGAQRGFSVIGPASGGWAWRAWTEQGEETGIATTKAAAAAIAEQEYSRLLNEARRASLRAV